MSGTRRHKAVGIGIGCTHFHLAFLGKMILSDQANRHIHATGKKRSVFQTCA
jgi:hypothetical protein